MDLATSLNLLAIAVYLGASGYLAVDLLRQRPPRQGVLLGLALLALLFHGLGAYLVVFVPGGIRTGVFTIPTLFFWVINALAVASSVKKPLHNLFVLLFPLAAVAIASSLLTDSPPSPEPAGIIGHILLSVLAYGILTIATVQALVLAFQDYQLKHKHATGVVRLLPPLQTMESLLFQLLWVGEIVLTLSIITGAMFIENMFAQNLAHKTVFSILTWLIYAVLLWGHQVKGWRGGTAVRWVVGGYIALWLAYFGVKFVYEVILA